MIEAELHRAVRARLIADTALAAIVSARVYDIAGPDAVLPCVEVGTMQFTAEGTDTSDEYRVSLNVGAYAKGPDAKARIREIAAAIHAALHRRGGDITMPSHRVLAIRWQSTTVFPVEPSPTGNEYKGVFVFRALVLKTAAVTGY